MSDNLIFRPPWKGYLKGLIYYINMNYPEELHDLITVTATSQKEEWATPDNIIDFITEHDETDPKDGNWASLNYTNSSVTIKFNNHHISPTHYTLRSRPDSVENTPHEWKVEGSNDGINWTLLDHQPYNDIFQQKIGMIKTFKMSYNGVFSMFKITQLGKSNNNSYFFHVSRFELFGSLSLKGQPCYIPLLPQTCNILYKTNYNLFAIMIAVFS